MLILRLNGHNYSTHVLYLGILTSSCLLIFGTINYLEDQNSHIKYLDWIGIVFLCLSTFFSVGIMTIPGIMQNVLFAQKIRPLQKSVSRGVNSMLSFLSMIVSYVLS